MAGARRPVVVPHELGAVVPDPHVAHDLQLHARDLNLSIMGGQWLDIANIRLMLYMLQHSMIQCAVIFLSKYAY